MPYCPKCRDEFQDWVKVCPDCGVALVEKLPPTPPKVKKQDEPLVHIATARDEQVASMWSDILKEHSINCLVKGDDPSAAMFPGYMRCEIYVLASEAKEAQEILASFPKGLDRVPMSRWRMIGTKREQKRKRAYHYIVEMMETHMELPPDFSKKHLANILALSDNDRSSIEINLDRLELGKADPSPELIAAFKHLFVPLIGKDEINSHLVTPFLSSS